MKHRNWVVAVMGLSSAIALAACGGGGGGSVESATLRSAPGEFDKATLVEGAKSKSLYVPGEQVQGDLKLTGRFEAVLLQDQKVVNDHVTGLMWQQDEDATGFSWNEAEAYLAKMNADKTAGFDNWRIPTAEELASLLTPSKNNDYYLDAVFHKELLNTWTSDQVKDAMLSAWFVDFNEGKLTDGNRAAGTGHVRLVR